jgi:hypothetical protein
MHESKYLPFSIRLPGRFWPRKRQDLRCFLVGCPEQRLALGFLFVYSTYFGVLARLLYRGRRDTVRQVSMIRMDDKFVVKADVRLE